MNSDLIFKLTAAVIAYGVVVGVWTVVTLVLDWARDSRPAPPPSGRQAH